MSKVMTLKQTILALEGISDAELQVHKWHTGYLIFPALGCFADALEELGFNAAIDSDREDNDLVIRFEGE